MNNEFEKENIAEEENIETAEDELFGESFLDQTVSIDQKISIPKTVSEDEKKSKRGLKLFCILLALAITISSLVTGAYYFGKSQAVSQELNKKPDGVEYGSAASVYQSVSESIVGVYVYNRDKKVYNVSGIVYSSDGYIVITDSILASVPAAKFRVMTNDGNEYSASFAGGDQRSDIAVLKINESVNLKAAVFGNSNETVVGERVFSIGRANGYNNSAVLSEGIVSGLNVRVTNGTTSYSAKRIQTTSAINPGDFGGALTNEYGQVVGMLSTKVVSTGYEQISYSVPSVELKNIAEQIINNGRVEDRARIGISYIVKNFADAEIEGLTAAGLLVADVDKESELYSQLKAGDIITELNGKRIFKDSEVLDVIESSKVGDQITLKIIGTDGKEKLCSSKLLSYKSLSSYSELPATDNSSNAEDYYEGY